MEGKGEGGWGMARMLRSPLTIDPGVWPACSVEAGESQKDVVTGDFAVIKTNK